MTQYERLSENQQSDETLAVTLEAKSRSVGKSSEIVPMSQHSQ